MYIPGLVTRLGDGSLVGDAHFETCVCGNRDSLVVAALAEDWARVDRSVIQCGRLT